MDRHAFERLLSALHPDRDQAADKYELIRHQLIKFFECRGCPDPDDRSDQTIDRVARKLSEGEDIRAVDPALYFYGVARNVLRESWREQRQQEQFVHPSNVAVLPHDPALASDSLADLRLACLERCLANLSADDRQLIVWYYQSGERVLVGARRELAGRLGIPLNALRLRVQRIRDRLAVCAHRCVEEVPGPPASATGIRRLSRGKMKRDDVAGS